MPTLPPVVWRLVASAVAGVVLALGFPPYDLWLPLVPLGVAALTVTIRGTGARVGAACGLTAGLTFYLVLVHWLSVIGVDAWLLVSVACAVFVAALGAGTSLVTRLPWWPVWVACLWVAAEAARDRFPVGGFPWGRLAFGDERFLFTPYASFGGAPLVTFVTALAGALLAWAAVNVRTRSLAAVGAVALAAAIPATALAIPAPTEGRDVTVAVVQGNVPRSGLDFEGQRRAVLDNHVEATTRLAADIKAGRVAKPDVVIWPENASDLDPFTNPDAYAAIDDAVRTIGVPVLVGTVVHAKDGKHVENAGYVWDPVTGPGERYTKRHLVPFGEYIPFRGLLGDRISRLGRIEQDFLPGKVPGALQLGPARIGDVICFEVGYDGIVRDAVRAGGQTIVVQTNNATYGRKGQPQQQALMSRLRAVEHGRTVLVASTSGISQVVRPDGTVTATTGEFEQRVLVATVPLRTSRTLADHVGAWPELALTIVGLSAVVVAVRRRRPSADPSDQAPAAEVGQA